MNHLHSPAQDLLAQRAYERWAHLSTADDVAGTLGKFTPYAELPAFHREIWLAVVDEVCRGAWCTDCLALLVQPGHGVLVRYTTPEGQPWQVWSGSTADITAIAAANTINQFTEMGGSYIGVYASTVAGNTPVCQTHFRIRLAQNLDLPPGKRTW